MVAANMLRPTSERVHEVATAIRKTNSDVVCLQEVFDEDAAETLKESLRRQGYTHFIYNAGPSSWKLNSGLFIASKYKLKNPVYWKHAASSGWDSYSGKGTLAVTVEVGSKRLALFDTHFNGPAANDHQARKAQMNTFLQQVEEYNAKYRLNNRFIACGDFNAKKLNQLSSRFDNRYLDVPARNEKGTLFDVENDPKVGYVKDRIRAWAILEEEGPIDHVITSSNKDSILPLNSYISRMDGALRSLRGRQLFFYGLTQENQAL
jgi:endonuclease/exonuclease/phosphatase family metal-dependent hydrolase